MRTDSEKVLQRGGDHRFYRIFLIISYKRNNNNLYFSTI